MFYYLIIVKQDYIIYIVILQTPTLYFKTVYCVTLDKVNGFFLYLEFSLYIYALVYSKNIIYVSYNFGDSCPVSQDQQCD